MLLPIRMDFQLNTALDVRALRRFFLVGVFGLGSLKISSIDPEVDGRGVGWTCGGVAQSRKKCKFVSELSITTTDHRMTEWLTSHRISDVSRVHRISHCCQTE